MSHPYIVLTIVLALIAVVIGIRVARKGRSADTTTKLDL